MRSTTLLLTLLVAIALAVPVLADPYDVAGNESAVYHYPRHMMMGHMMGYPSGYGPDDCPYMQDGHCPYMDGYDAGYGGMMGHQMMGYDPGYQQAPRYGYSYRESHGGELTTGLWIAALLGVVVLIWLWVFRTIQQMRAHRHERRRRKR